ncbi:MAG TPA: prepilin-type N-terminal cleavage/methylation domain-containing protein [Gemmatimonadales bacterium]|nr:prepilin-type N-terminal cleavage/methylation domain-containing protein [Gemmatimonadales bacterium]
MRAPANGFTLIEVVVAIAILGGVALTVGAATGKLVRNSGDDRIATQAAAAAEAQLALVQVWPEYATIDSAFAGTATNTPQTGWTRVTTVVRTGGTGQANDYKKITVTITAPGLSTPVRRSLTVAATL